MGLKNWINDLPMVISCCFCCFLRAGNMCISIFSCIVGLIFVPNVARARGFWDMDVILSNYSQATEGAVQITLGVVSIMLCIVSGFLMVGACCNLPSFIMIYQLGAVVYSFVVMILYLVLIVLCFFVHSNCLLAGGLLCVMLLIHLLVTGYFLIVTNSLRISLIILKAEELKEMA